MQAVICEDYWAAKHDQEHESLESTYNPQVPDNVFNSNLVYR